MENKETIDCSIIVAEYIALSDVTRELIWLKGLLLEMGINVNSIKVYEDNSSCISMASGNSISKRSKHMDVKLHFIREYVDKGEIQLCKIDSQQQIVDGFTKSLAPEKFKKFVNDLNLY